jgi:hypothetical protein
MQTWEYRLVGFDKPGRVMTTIHDSFLATALVQVRTIGRDPYHVAMEYVNGLADAGWEVVTCPGERYLLRRPRS